MKLSKIEIILDEQEAEVIRNALDYFLEMNDIFRKYCADLSDTDKQVINDAKTQAEALYNVFSSQGGKCSDIAKERLEEAVMWFVKGVTEKYYV